MKKMKKMIAVLASTLLALLPIFVLAMPLLSYTLAPFPAVASVGRMTNKEKVTLISALTQCLCAYKIRVRNYAEIINTFYLLKYASNQYF